MSEAQVTQQGQISPINAFTEPGSGLLTPISFRFLHSLLAQINSLQTQVNTLKNRLDNTPGAPP